MPFCTGPGVKARGANAWGPGLVTWGGEGREEQPIPAECRPSSGINRIGVVIRDPQGRAEGLPVEVLHAKGALQQYMDMEVSPEPLEEPRQSPKHLKNLLGGSVFLIRKRTVFFLQKNVLTNC